MSILESQGYITFFNTRFQNIRPSTKTTPKVNQYFQRYNTSSELYLTTLKTLEIIFKTVPCSESPIIQNIPIT